MLGVPDRNIVSATKEVTFEVEGYNEVDGSRGKADMGVLNVGYGRTYLNGKERWPDNDV